MPIFFAACCLTLAHSALAGPVWKIAPDKGFIDDPLAFGKDDTQLAFIHTDASSFMTLIVAELPSGKRRLEIKLDQVKRVPRALRFTADGNGVLFVYRDPDQGTAGAILFELAGGKRVKPYHYGKKRAGQSGGGGGNQYDYAAPDSFQIVAAGRVAVEASGKPLAQYFSARGLPAHRKVWRGCSPTELAWLRERPGRDLRQHETARRPQCRSVPVARPAPQIGRENGEVITADGHQISRRHHGQRGTVDP